MKNNIFFIFAIALAFCQRGNAIKCYDCHSVTDKRCVESSGVEGTSGFEKNCNDPPPGWLDAERCQSVVRYWKQNLTLGQEVEDTIRGCMYRNPKIQGDDCGKSLFVRNVYHVHCTSCGEDYCNSAGREYLNLLTHISCLLTTVLVTRSFHLNLFDKS